ncbi:MAG: sulfatase-like hydrolase/transferase [Bacteroidales bacterium]|nr:sulfatase-like hydrolase/transferase [Bacteroidales bacterium]
MDRLYKYIKQYAVLAVCFIVALFAMKTLEVILTMITGTVTSLSGLVYGNLIPAGFIIGITFLIFFLISLFSKKTALYVSAVLFGIMLLTETGLSIYYATTGILMGKELIIRPLWEMIHTVKSALNIWMIIGVIVFFIAYLFVTVWFSKKNIGKPIVFALILLVACSIPLFFTIRTNQDKAVINKTLYCVRECITKTELMEGMELSLTKTDYNPAVVKKYLEMFPERQVIDNECPLERKDDIKNVLGPYFKKSDVKPNVVVIIVESLGTDLFGVNENGYCYTPFLDSLSKHSLLWVNCMATTPRSFGAVPAVTGSVPHGLKGFQFGNIPNHNSLFTILADNGYSTNAFYAGNFSFDRIYDYLVAQNIDYMSPFYEEYKKDKSKDRDGTYWGYHDDVMFQKSMQIIEKQGKKPSLDLFVTISQHEDLQLCDKNRQKRFYDEAKGINPSSGMIGKMASTLYADDAIRHFMNRYNAYDKEGNTIFIITGDHSMNLDANNPLDAYHVPLIIWSPLLERPARFEAVVSHNDITPSLLELLKNNYGIHMPETVSWVSDGIDTLPGFHSNIRNYFLHYSRELKDFVWNDMYYTMADAEHPVSRIVEGVKIEPLDNQEIAKDLSEKFKTMVYVDNYVYSNNKLTKSPILGEKFEMIKMVKLVDSVYCASKPEKPSVSKPKSTLIYSEKIDGKYDEIKLVMTSDIMYTGHVWQDATMELVVECIGNKMEKVYSWDYILKYVMSRYPTVGKWQKMELTKIISVNNSNGFELKVYMIPTHKDEMWDPEHTVTLKNVNINILGLKNQ